MADSENPIIVRKKILGFIETDPVTMTVATSVFTNMFLVSTFIFGFTGCGKKASLAAISTIPFSIHSCLKDADNDFKEWQKQSKLRERGIPDRFLPYKCKYNWTGYEEKMRFTSIKVENNGNIVFFRKIYDK